MLSDDILFDLADAMTYRPRRGSDRGASAATKRLSPSSRKPLLAHRIAGMASTVERSKLAVGVMTRIASRAPEVVVKVTGSKAVGGATRAHLRYIGRVGHPEERAVHMENEKGEILPSQDGLRLDGIASQWESWELEDGARRSGKVTNALVFSLAPGADPQKVLAATRETMAELFPEHRYVMALHNDTAHPHVHVAYAFRNIEGQRTFLSHGDKQQLRETFAEKLNDLGVEANATLRKTRGLNEQPDRKGVHHRRAEGREVRIDKEEVDGSKRAARHVRHRELVENVFSRSIATLSRSGEPEHADIARSLSAFVGARVMTPTPSEKEPIGTVTLGGERIDLAKLDPQARHEVLEMAARSRERDDRALARRAGVSTDETGKRSVQLGGEKVDLDRLDSATQRNVLEMAARAREREASKSSPDHAVGVAGGPPGRGPNQDLRASAERLREATRAIEQTIRDRSKDRKGPDR